jgi:hypothetical protein
MGSGTHLATYSTGNGEQFTRDKGTAHETDELFFTLSYVFRRAQAFTVQEFLLCTRANMRYENTYLLSEH